MHRGDAMMWNSTQYYILKDGPVWIFKSSFGQPSVCSDGSANRSHLHRQTSALGKDKRGPNREGHTFPIHLSSPLCWLYSGYFKLIHQTSGRPHGDNRSSEARPRRVGWLRRLSLRQGASPLFQPSHKAPVKAVPNMGQKAQITLRWFLGVPHSYVPENDKSNKTVWSCSPCAIVSGR